MKAGFTTGATPPGGTPTGAPSFTPPPAAELGKLFPQLEVVELLGQGGMGAVYRARQPALDRWVALKILPPQARPDFAERFVREARALARLNHPNIVAVHEFGQAGRMPYFVMEFVEGVTLRRLVKEHRLPPRQALQIVPQICEALQFAHDEGVVHRDIKPENILLDKKGRVKIADFGIAKLVGGEPERTTLTQDHVLGTPHYMAPEQIEHPQAVDHRADIFSLGVVFYEMLTGELPLGKFAPPSRLVQVDVRLDEIVLHALEKQPERRYQHAHEVKTDVEIVSRAAPPEEPAAAVSGGSKQAAGGCRIPSPVSESEMPPRPEPLLRTPWPAVKAVIGGDLLSSVWALAAVVLLVGRKVARTEPLMYSFFGVGGWYYPTGYNLLAVTCFTLALFCLVVPRLAAAGRQGAPSRRRACSLWANGLGSGWMLVALVLLVGRKVARTEPLMYSFFGVGGWYYPSDYHFIVAVCFAFALAWLAVPRVLERAGRASRTEAEVTTVTLEDGTLAGAIRRLQVPAWGVLVAGSLDLVPIVAVPLKYMVATGVESAEQTSTEFLGLPLLAVLFIDAVIIAGASRMRRLASRRLAILASILALLLPPGALVGLPFGIWALVLLYQPDVRAAFAAMAQAGVAPAARPSGFRMAAWATVLPLGLALVWAWWSWQKENSGASGPLTQIELPSVAAPRSPVVGFGPVTEVTLNDLDGARGSDALDLDDRQLLDLPNDLRTRPENEQSRWLKEHSVDMLVDNVAGRWGLLTPTDNRLRLALLPEAQWGSLTDSELSQALAVDSPGLEIKQRRFWTVFVLATNAQPPLTFAFQTGAGTRGLLQISALGPGPVPFVRLRYKIVQNLALALPEGSSRRLVAAR